MFYFPILIEMTEGPNKGTLVIVRGPECLPMGNAFRVIYVQLREAA